MESNVCILCSSVRWHHHCGFVCDAVIRLVGELRRAMPRLTSRLLTANATASPLIRITGPSFATSVTLKFVRTVGWYKKQLLKKYHTNTIRKKKKNTIRGLHTICNARTEWKLIVEHLLFFRKGLLKVIEFSKRLAQASTNVIQQAIPLPSIKTNNAAENIDDKKLPLNGLTRVVVSLRKKNADVVTFLGSLSFHLNKKKLVKK